MYKFKFMLFICLACIIIIVNAQSSSVCEREPGDTLLMSQPLIQILLFGKPVINKRFEGYRITCIETNLPLKLRSLVNLNIVNGGVGCDSFGLRVSIGNLLYVGLGINVYGVKVQPGDTALSICSNVK